MANKEHLAILRQGVDAWNNWRKKNSDTKPDLYGADLREADLMLVNLCGTDLGHADLSYADLSFADLSYADLSFAILSYADLSGTNLNDAVLYKTIVYEANLCSADFARADLSDADLRGADLSGTNLREAILNGTNLKGANVEQAMFGNNAGAPLVSDHQSEQSEPDRSEINQDGSADLSNDRSQPANGTHTAEAVANLLPQDSPLSVPQGGRFTISEGLTESLFGHELYISVGTLSSSQANFSIGSLGHPTINVVAATIGDRTVYLDKFEIYLMAIDSFGATFLVERMDFNTAPEREIEVSNSSSNRTVIQKQVEAE